MDEPFMTVKQMVAEIRHDVKELGDKIDRIDHQGPVGVKEDLVDHEDRLRHLERTSARGLGIVAALSFIMPVLATVSWHLWGG